MKKVRFDILILYFTIAVVMIGFGIIIPIIPFYIKKFGASGSALGLLITTYAIGQFLFVPIWGIASDKYGRKPILILGVIGNALAHLIFALSNDLWMLFASRAVAGMLSSATLPTAMAYIGDSTDEKERSSKIGKLSAAMGAGVIMGPFLGGKLAMISLPLPFYVASILSILTLGPILTLLPESLPPEARNISTVKTGSRFKNMWAALFGPIAFLLVLSFLIDFGLMTWEGVFSLFALDQYGYGPDRIAEIIVMVGIIAVIMQGIIIGPLTSRFGDVNVIRASLLFCAVFFVVMLTAKTDLWVFITVGLFVFSNSLLRPSVASYISKTATGGQGEAMGLNNSFMSLGRIIGPAFGGFVYDINVQMPYLAGGAIMLVGFIASLIWLKSNKKS